MVNKKTLIAGSIITLGMLGTATAFAATTSGVNGLINSTSTGSSTGANGSASGSSDGNFARPARGLGMETDVATILGLDANTLHADLQAGQSLVQIAQTKGISEATLIADLKASQKTHLDQAVQSGKMTTAQEQTMLSKMDAQLKQMVEQKGGFEHGPNGMGMGHGPGPGFGGPGSMSGLTTTLGLSAATLQADFQAGQSLVQIAQTKGISEATLIADLKASQKTQMDSAVQSGKMTAAQEQTMLSNMDAHLKQMVEQKGGFEHGPNGMGMGHGPGPGFGGPGSMSGLTTTLGLSAATLQADFQAGQSLVQIAQTKGISEATLIADLKASEKTEMDSAVQSGKMTAAQEQTMLSNMDAHLKQMVEQKGGFEHGPNGMGMGHGHGPGENNGVQGGSKTVTSTGMNSGTSTGMNSGTSTGTNVGMSAGMSSGI